MNRYSVLILLLLVTLFTLACGGSSNRQLQSITVTTTTSGTQVQFTASGTFSAPPISVTPLAVDWSAGFLAPPPPGNMNYMLSTQPYVLNCPGSGTVLQATALAPQDPGAPGSGSLPFAKLVTGHSAMTCP